MPNQPSSQTPPAYPGKPAVRQKLKARIALAGVSKQGKTLAALGLARGLVGPGGRIYVVDSDNGSAKLYAGTQALATEGQPTGFDSANLTPPYHPDRFTAQLNYCGPWAVDCIILDTVTAEWSGTGGMQELVDEFKKRGGGTGWDKAVPFHNRFLNAIIQCPAHVIATIRLKSDTRIETGDDGKLKIRKVGLKPEQRDQFDYEFTIVGTFDAHDLMLEGRGGFAERIIRAHEDTADIEAIAKGYVDLGRDIGAWLNQGEAPPAAPEQVAPAQPEPEPEPEPTPAEPEPEREPEPVPPTTPPASPQSSAPASASTGTAASDGLDVPPPSSNGAEAAPSDVPMNNDQRTAIAAKMATCASLRPNGDWQALVDAKARDLFGLDGWDSASVDQATRLLELLEQAILQIREQDAAVAASA
jgi:hypothetical protein